MKAMDSFIKNCNSEVFIQATRYESDNFYGLFCADLSSKLEYKMTEHYHDLTGGDMDMFEAKAFFNDHKTIEAGIILVTGNTIEDVIIKLRIKVEEWEKKRWPNG